MLMTTAGALVIGAVVASAGPSSSVVVAPAKVTGDARSSMSSELTGASSRAVTDAGAAPVDMPSGCQDEACATKAAGANGYVLSTTVDAQDSDYEISVRLTDGTGKVVDERAESCEICNHDELTEAVQALVSAAVTPVAQAVPPPPPPAPPSASPPTEPEPEDTRSKPKPLRALGFAGIGVGVGSLAAGIALIVLNERPGGSCDGSSVDANGDCEFRYNTLGGGVGLTIGGALAVGAGVGLVMLSRSRKPSKRSDKVSVSASAGGLRLRF